MTKIDYGNDEIETYAYDKWGRLAERTRGKRTESYSYDHFGRLVKRNENGMVFTYAYDAWGRRTRRTEFRLGGGGTTEERRSYDKYGRLVEIASFGSSVKYFYDERGRVARQVVDGTPIDFAYTKYGQLADKYLGGKQNPEAAVEYEYSKAGQIAARTANGIRQTYEYDGRGQLLAVKEDGEDVERYVYDKAGNMVKKTLLRRGRAVSTKPPSVEDYVTTTFAFDGANQLVSSTTDGVTTKFAYDAAGRLVREGDKTYRYGYLDKVLSVTVGDRAYTYDYHVDGQLATANYGRAGAPRTPQTESFLWDGLALIKRGDERFVNEPHVGGGNPVVSSRGTTYFNDILGTTVGVWEGRAPSRPKSERRYSAAALTAFGERMTDGNDGSPASRSLGEGWFTGKPHVAGLGHAFLMRNYRADLAKWQTGDPMGYPDGWNALAYCKNGVTDVVDLWGCAIVTSTVYEGGVPSNPNYGGETGWSYRITNINSVTHTISIEVLVSISFSENLKNSSDFESGDIVTYTPHNGPSGGVLTPSLAVRGAVVAHEYGHANYVTGVICSSLQSLLRLLEIKWSVNELSEDRIKNEIISVCNAELMNSLVGFSNAANDPTISWFESSPEWIRVHDDKIFGFWAWKKE